MLCPITQVTVTDDGIFSDISGIGESKHLPVAPAGEVSSTGILVIVAIERYKLHGITCNGVRIARGNFSEPSDGRVEMWYLNVGDELGVTCLDDRKPSYTDHVRHTVRISINRSDNPHTPSSQSINVSETRERIVLPT